MDLQPDNRIISKYENITPQIKAFFTKKYNEACKTSIVRRKKKEIGDSGVKYDDEGNVIEDASDHNADYGDEDDENKNVSVKTKKEKSVKSNQKSKSTAKKTKNKK